VLTVKVKQTILLVSFLVLAAGSTAASPNTLTGRVVGVADGDTITILDADKAQHKIRLAGIDAPEKRQAYSEKAKKALCSKVFGKQVDVTYSGKDRYGRIVGNVRINGRWINKELVAEGWAWYYNKYSSDKVLAAAEVQARKEKLGFWEDSSLPLPPWEYRLKAKQRSFVERTSPSEVQSKPATATYWLNTGSDVRHNSSCRYYMNTKRGRLCTGKKGRGCGICGG